MYAKRRKILLVALHLQPCPQVNSEADNVSPEEARGVRELQVRANEPSREKRSNDERSSLKRDPQFAEKLLQQGCSRGHAPSCYNLAVMYTQGDEGIEKSEEKAKEYQDKTEELVKRFGTQNLYSYTSIYIYIYILCT